MRPLLLGGVAAALALTAVPASAQHHVECTPSFRVVCSVLDLTHAVCVETKYTPCD